MCLIVDANVAIEFFCGRDPQYEDLRSAVFGGGCCVVYGGRLRDEYERTEKARHIVVALDRAGKARAVPDLPIKELTAELEMSGSLVSDDPHIIALALVSGSRLLHSSDKALHIDFTNPVVLSSPRGKVYQGKAKHHHLVTKMCVAC